MTESENGGGDVGGNGSHHKPPGMVMVETDCVRCGGQTKERKKRTEQALCDDCEDELESMGDSKTSREITPMDKRWQ